MLISYIASEAPLEEGIITFVTKEEVKSLNVVEAQESIKKALTTQRPLVNSGSPRLLASTPQYQVELANYHFKTYRDASNLYVVDESLAVTLPLAEEVKSYAKPIRLDTTVINELAPKKTIRFHLPDVGRVDAIITLESKNPDDSKTFIGDIQSDSGNNKLILTVGKVFTFATITTPYDSYSIQAKHGQGFVIAQRHERSFVDPNEPDFLTDRDLAKEVE